MDRYQKLFSYFAFVALMLGITVVASAQYRDRNRGYGSYGNTNIKSTVKSLEGQARRFEDSLDKELDRSRYDGSRQEDYLNGLAENFKNAAENLKDEYYDNGSYSARDEAQRVLQLGNQLGRSLRQSRIARQSTFISGAWNNIEVNLRRVARSYNLNYRGTNGSWGRNDRNRRNDRNNRTRRNDRRNDRYSNARSTINNLKYKAKNFEDRLDDDRYSRSNSRLENLSDRFKNAVDDLADDYDDRDGGFNEAQRVLQIGQQLDQEIAQTGVGRSVRNDWRSIERDLRQLSRAYNISYNGNNSRRGGLGNIIRNWPF